MALGDNWNDLEMLEFAGLPIVMGNAVPELKTRGWTVTLTNDENGVAESDSKVCSLKRVHSENEPKKNFVHVVVVRAAVRITDQRCADGARGLRGAALGCAATHHGI